jgi:DDE superfamily endonuclease
MIRCCTLQLRSESQSRLWRINSEFIFVSAMIGPQLMALVKRRRQQRQEEEEEEENNALKKRQQIFQSFVLFQFLSSMNLEGASFFDKGPTVRAGNSHRNRQLIIDWSRQLDDTMFTRQFRVCREDFFYVLFKIEPGLKKDESKALNSSGSSVSPYIMLMITLRILAGASYLDMIHYQVHVDSVCDIVWRTVSEIHERIDNIKKPETEDDCKALSDSWCEIQKKRWGTVLTAGTILAGDGLVIEIAQPSVKCLRGRPISVFRNRKSLWGVIVQAFCDAFTKFHVFDVKWPGGTNDIIAYKMTDLFFKATEDGGYPKWATFVLDEAYSSIGGMHLTPYSYNQLKGAKSIDEEKYFRMLCFNNVLSSQRITIERAFGILVRRWGILWRPITYGLAKVPTIVRVCAMLHNICVDRWLKKHPLIHLVNGEAAYPDVLDHVELDDMTPTDKEVINRLHNNYSRFRQRAHDNSIKNLLADEIFDTGIRMRNDTEYHPFTPRN